MEVSIGGVACLVTTPLFLLQDHTAMTEMTMCSHILAILDTINPSKLGT